MLPWMKDQKKNVAGVIMATRKPDGGFRDESTPETSFSDSDGLQACAEDIIKAIEAKDAKALATALQDAFDVMESQPHDENSSEDTE